MRPIENDPWKQTRKNLKVLILKNTSKVVKSHYSVLGIEKFIQKCLTRRRRIKWMVFWTDLMRFIQFLDDLQSPDHNFIKRLNWEISKKAMKNCVIIFLWWSKFLTVFFSIYRCNFSTFLWSINSYLFNFKKSCKIFKIWCFIMKGHGMRIFAFILYCGNDSEGFKHLMMIFFHWANIDQI